MPTSAHRLVLTILLLLAAVPASAQGNPEPAAGTDDPLAAVAWLAGHWVGEGLGGWNETLWSPPRAGAMMGVFRHVRDGEIAFYEILTLTMEGGTLVKSLKHFGPDLVGWEERDRSQRFPLIRVESDAVFFEGMTYRRTGADRVEITVMLGPDPEHLEPELFTYRRVPR